MESLGESSGVEMASGSFQICFGIPLGDLLEPLLEPRWRQDEPREPSWRQFGRHLGSFSGPWTRSLPKLLKCENEYHSFIFMGFSRIGDCFEILLGRHANHLGVMLDHLGTIFLLYGARMVSKSTKMSQHKRKRANPRGFGRFSWEVRPRREHSWQNLPRGEGGRAVNLKGLHAEAPKDSRRKHKGLTIERSTDSYRLIKTQDFKIEGSFLQGLQDFIWVSPEPRCPKGPADAPPISDIDAINLDKLVRP